MHFIVLNVNLVMHLNLVLGSIFNFSNVYEMLVLLAVLIITICRLWKYTLKDFG